MNTTPVGRPEDAEAAPFQLGYIGLVDGSDIRAVVRAQMAEALACFSGYSEETSLEPYAPGKWTLRQKLGHITDTERIFGFRVLWLARGLDGALPGFEQDRAVLTAEAQDVPWAAHLEEFERVRWATISLFDNLPDAAWMRTGEVSGHVVTVRALAFAMTGHVAHHLRILRELAV